jgi:hypothetical protein
MLEENLEYRFSNPRNGLQNAAIVFRGNTVSIRSFSKQKGKSENPCPFLSHVATATISVITPLNKRISG